LTVVVAICISASDFLLEAIPERERYLFKRKVSLF